MAGSSPPLERRADALSKERIVEAAVALLDAHGAGALTYRALAVRLATGAGALYWHVADKQTLLAAASDLVIARAVAEDAEGASPSDAVRHLALRVFDAIDGRPWLGAQLSGDPWQLAVLRILEAVGAQVTRLGVPEPARFDVATAFLSLVLGLAGQYAAGSRLLPPGADRTAVLREVAERWAQLDAAEHPFLHAVAPQLPEHDDRKQFLAGVDLMLAGIADLCA